ncbi:MAG: hypothetical protein HYU97_10825 [Deltaproteobacteria bacterium]|nr:hypothetical protein [Deltaproteobacteria bacterium]
MKNVIPAPACAGVNSGGNPELFEITGSLPEFTPAQAGAGMTEGAFFNGPIRSRNQRKPILLSDHVTLELVI